MGLSFERAMWLAKWIDDALWATLIRTREFAGVLGRLNFAASALVYEKPWLGPRYLWVSTLFGDYVDSARSPWAFK